MRKLNKPLNVLIFADAFNIMAAAMFGPIYAIFVKGIGGGILTISWSVALMSFASALVMFVTSRYEDRVKNFRTVIIFSYLLFSASYIMFIFVNSMVALLIVQFIVGSAYAIGTPAYDALYSKLLDKGEEAREWGNFEVMAKLVSTGGALLGGILATYFGFEALFITMSAFALMSAAISYYYLKG